MALARMGQIASLAWLASLGTAVLVAAAPARGDAGWPLFRSETGRFQVRFPAAPEETHSERESWAGAVSEGKAVYERDGMYLAVEHHDVPRAATWVVPSSVILGRAKAGILEDTGGRETGARDAEHQGHPGHVFTYSIPGDAGFEEEVLLLLVRNRLYVVAAGRERRAAAGWSPAPFFESFEVWLP